MLGALVPSSSELGLYGFATVCAFLPLLHLSIRIQARLPGLVRVCQDNGNLKRELNNLSIVIFYATAFWLVVACVVGYALKQGLVLPHLASAWFCLVVLGVSIVFKTVVFVTGAAFTARGQFGTSSVMAWVEIVVLAVLSVSWVQSANDMAVALLVASAVSAIVAGVLLRWVALR
jgi:hypothetical protein